MVLFLKSSGQIFKKSWIMPQQEWLLRQLLTPLSFTYNIFIWLDKQRKNTWQPPYMIPHTPHYCHPYQSMKLTLYIYRLPFPHHLCCFCSIKILTNWPIKVINSVFYHYLYQPTPPPDALSTRFIIFFIGLYPFFPCGNFSNSLPTWNIENGVIVYCGVPTSHICTKPCKLMGRNFQTSGNKLITPYHAYYWSLLRVTPIFNSPYSTSLPPSPMYLPSSFFISSQNLFKRYLVWFELNQPSFPLLSKLSIIF